MRSPLYVTDIVKAIKRGQGGQRDKASISPENQEAACRDLPAVQACTKVTVYSDLGISGGKPPEKRPGSLALRQRLEAADKNHEPLVIAAYDQSRWSRDDVDSMQFYAFLEARPWINIQMIDGSFERSPDGQWSWGMRALNAQHQRKLTAKKIKAAYAAKNAKGQPTGPAPFGYRYAGDKRDGKTLEIDPVVAPIVLRIFNLYADGDHSTRTIADTLNTEGVPALAATKGRWMGDSVGHLLQNVAYIGKTFAESRLKRTGDLIPAAWPAIISETLFQRVQDRLKAKRLTIVNGRHSRPFTFRGLLWCTHCQRRLTAQASGTTVYYRCGSYEWPTAQRCELAKRAIHETEILPWFDLIAEGLEQGQISGNWLLPRASEKVDRETAVEIVAKIDRKIKRTGDRYADEELSREEYRDLVAKLRRQKDAYIAMAAEEPDPKDLSTLSSAWKTGDAAQRWEVLNALFQRIHVRQDRKVEGYTPRMDRAKKVRMLISTAFASYYDWPEPEPEDGPGAAVANRLRRGGAGI